MQTVLRLSSTQQDGVSVLDVVVDTILPRGENVRFAILVMVQHRTKLSLARIAKPHVPK
jgi:hypothetical protein